MQGRNLPVAVDVPTWAFRTTNPLMLTTIIGLETALVGTLIILDITHWILRRQDRVETHW